MTTTTFKATKNNVSMALDGAQLAGDATWTVQAGQGAQCPAAPFYVSCDSEVALCTLRVADVLTVTRGQDGTAAAGHNAGALVEVRAVAGLFADLATAVGALEAGNNGNPRSNLLVNGGFEGLTGWQRGNGPFTGSTTYSADRWYNGLTGTDTLSVSRNTANVDAASAACAACTFVLGSGAGASFLGQKLEDFTQLRGRAVSFSIRVRTATANAVRVGIYDGTAWNYSTGYHAGDGAYATLTATATIGAAAASAYVGVFFAATCTAYLDNAMLVVGSSPADYVPLQPADETGRDLRYYEKAVASIRWWAQNAGVTQLLNVPMRATKCVSPTVTITPGTRANIASATLSAQDTNFVIYAYAPTLVAPTDTYALSDIYVLEANP